MRWADLPEQLTSLVLKEVTLTENSILSIYIFFIAPKKLKKYSVFILYTRHEYIKITIILLVWLLKCAVEQRKNK